MVSTEKVWLLYKEDLRLEDDMKPTNKLVSQARTYHLFNPKGETSRCSLTTN